MGAGRPVGKGGSEQLWATAHHNQSRLVGRTGTQAAVWCERHASDTRASALHHATSHSLGPPSLQPILPTRIVGLRRQGGDHQPCQQGGDCQAGQEAEEADACHRRQAVLRLLPRLHGSGGLGWQGLGWCWESDCGSTVKERRLCRLVLVAAGTWSRRQLQAALSLNGRAYSAHLDVVEAALKAAHPHQRHLDAPHVEPGPAHGKRLPARGTEWRVAACMLG